MKNDMRPYVIELAMRLAAGRMVGQQANNIADVAYLVIEAVEARITGKTKVAPTPTAVKAAARGLVSDDVDSIVEEVSARASLRNKNMAQRELPVEVVSEPPKRRGKIQDMDASSTRVQLSELREKLESARRNHKPRTEIQRQIDKLEKLLQGQ